MKTISAKLRSNRGSSMVMALILMLVAMMVSHTILAAAATAGQNVQLGDDGQQAYLTVSSAAETYRDAVLSFQEAFRKTVTKTYENDQDYSADRPKTTTTAYTHLETAPFSAEVEAALKYAIVYPAVTYTHTYLIRAENYDDVDMVLTMEPPKNASGYYTLTAVFSNVIPGRDLPDNPYRITVSFRAELKEVSSRYEEGRLRESTVTWLFSRPEFTRTKEASNG